MIRNMDMTAETPHLWIPIFDENHDLIEIECPECGTRYDAEEHIDDKICDTCGSEVRWE